MKKPILEPTASSEGEKNPPSHKALIKTLHSYRNRNLRFDLNSVSRKGFMLVIFEAFWLPLAEWSCRELRPISITQQCSPSPRACWAGVVFQSIHHVRRAPAFPRKLERFVGKALLHNTVSTGYTVGKVRSRMAAAQEMLTQQGGLWKVGSRYPCSPVQCHQGKGWGGRQDKRENVGRISSRSAVTSVHLSWPRHSGFWQTQSSLGFAIWALPKARCCNVNGLLLLE